MAMTSKDWWNRPGHLQTLGELQQEESSNRDRAPAPMSTADLYSEHENKKQQYRQTALEQIATRQKYESDIMEKNLLKNAFSTQSFDKNIKEDYNTNTAMADNLFKIGRQMMSIDLSKGLSITKQAGDLKQKAEEDNLKSLHLVKERHAVIGELASGIKDQDSLNEAVSELSKANVIIPTKYRVWNNETKDYFQQQSKGTKIAKENLELDLKVKAAELAKQKETRMAKEAEISDKYKDRKFAWLQSNKVGPKTTPFKDPSIDMMMDNQKQLREGSEDFADLKLADQTAAAKDYSRRAYYHQKEGVTDPAVAYEMAKEDILSKIKDGKYEGFKSDTSSPKDKVIYTNAPAVGTVQSGYKYKGGDPSKQESWEKI